MKKRTRARMIVLLAASIGAALTMGPAWAAKRSIPDAPADYLAKTNPMAEKADALTRGAKLYEKRCQKCHGAKGDGLGKSAQGLEPPVPSFLDGYIKGRKDGQLFWIVENGSANTDMDSFGPGTSYNLSHDDIWSVVAFMRKKFAGK